MTIRISAKEPVTITTLTNGLTTEKFVIPSDRSYEIDLSPTKSIIAIEAESIAPDLQLSFDF